MSRGVGVPTKVLECVDEEVMGTYVIGIPAQGRFVERDRTHPAHLATTPGAGLFGVAAQNPGMGIVEVE